MTRPASLPDSRPTLRCLSLGMGIQSSAVLLLACEGKIPRFDVALFADTGWEPRPVYENLARLRAHAAKFGIPVRTASAGNIRHDALGDRRTCAEAEGWVGRLGHRHDPDLPPQQT